MSELLVRLFIRDEDDLPACQSTNEYDGEDNLRILAIFMILISSFIGTFFPLLSSKFSFVRLPDLCWFLAKFFGSGVIIATGFMHLLEPASDALGNECLGGTFANYPWAFAICLMSLFVLFLTEIVAHYYVAKASASADGVSHSHFGNFGHDDDADDVITIEEDEEGGASGEGEEGEESDSLNKDSKISIQRRPSANVPGSNHYAHDIEHQGGEEHKHEQENYLNQIFSVFVLEFGVIFHSVFIGLSLAVTGEDEFTTLFIVLVFHQMFEGLGLGTRIAETPWDYTRRYTPWLLAMGFTITTPIAVAIGIGVRHSFVPGSRTALIANGVFDSISAGILIYTGIVELMAHEFLYSTQFKGPNGLKKMLLAYFVMCWGAGLMALLAKWA